MLEKIEPAPPDAILGLTEAFRSDNNPRKINLGVGIYMDASGSTPVLDSVKRAEKLLLNRETTKAYLPIDGAEDYGRLVRELLFGEDQEILARGWAVTAQTPGGTGALRVGADMLNKFFPDACLWVSRPTWANHKGIFTAAGFIIKEYAYYDAESHGLDFQGLCDALRAVPAGDIVLLHACCHNPTGVDLSAEQWREVASIAAERGWLPFVDFAYQGFGSGLEEDRVGLLALAEAVPELFVSSSFSKNFGLYRERVGALTCVTKDKDTADAVLTRVKKSIRVNYSNPPAHGAAIVATILQDEELRTLWKSELDEMRRRIASVRHEFVEALKKKGVAMDFTFIEEQKGMFSFSGLTPAQVEFLRREKSIYIVGSGRINVAGITPANIDYLCDAIAEAV